MLMVRLQRVGRVHEPVFRLVLTDSKNGPKRGKFLEILGNYDARKAEKAEFNVEKIKQWITKGAKLSDTIHNLLVERKVLTGKKINNLPKKKPVISEKPPEMPKIVPEKPVEEMPAPIQESESQPENVGVAEEVVA